jgi:hypothetical protein
MVWNSSANYYNKSISDDVLLSGQQLLERRQVCEQCTESAYHGLDIYGLLLYAIQVSVSKLLTRCCQARQKLLKKDVLARFMFSILFSAKVKPRRI